MYDMMFVQLVCFFFMNFLRELIIIIIITVLYVCIRIVFESINIYFQVYNIFLYYNKSSRVDQFEFRSCCYAFQPLKEKNTRKKHRKTSMFLII